MPVLKAKIRNKLLPMACKTFLAPKSFSKYPSDARKIFCRKEEMALLKNTSNNVFVINKGEEKLYFRECKKHKEIHEYVKDEIDFYYSWICEDVFGDKEFIEKALSEESNFKKFVNMGMTNDKYSGAYNFCMGNGGEYIGIKCDTPEREKRLIDFVQFIWGDLFSYVLNSGIKKDCCQIYNAVRSIAAYRASEFFEEKLVPKTEFAVIETEDSVQLFGTVMEEAPGTCFENADFELRKSVCSPNLQKELIKLNLLDAICLEKDHRPGNYNVETEDGKAVSVFAFDNDSPKSFGIGGISFGTYIGCSPFFKNNSVNRPFVDKKFAKKIISADEKEICRNLEDVLNVFQRYSLECRIRKIKKILSDLPEEKFISDDQWNKETMEEELSGKYGETYLSKFLNFQNKMIQPWIKTEKI